MAKRYVMLRMPKDIYDRYLGVKQKMESDISRVAGTPLKLSMPSVFNAVINPELNDNFIEVDLKKLRRLGKKIKGPL